MEGVRGSIPLPPTIKINGLDNVARFDLWSSKHIASTAVSFRPVATFCNSPRTRVRAKLQLTAVRGPGLTRYQPTPDANIAPLNVASIGKMELLS